MDTKTTILGQVIKFPVCISPFAMQCSLHPDGEIATAKGLIGIFLFNYNSIVDLLLFKLIFAC